MNIEDILININNEDKTVAHLIDKKIPSIKSLIEAIYPKKKVVVDYFILELEHLVD